MKRTTRRLAAPLAVAALVAVAGCSSGSSSSTRLPSGGGATSSGGSPATSSAGSPATSSAGSPATSAAPSIESGASLSVWLNANAQEKQEEALIDAWGQQNGVKITVQAVTSDSYQQTLQLAIKTGKAPDVWNGGDIRTMINSGAAMPLNGLLPPDITNNYKDELSGNKAWIVGGKIYTIPLETTTYRLLYNKDVFTQAGLDPNKPPTTLSELESDCKAIAAIKVSCLGVPLKYNGFVNKMVEEPVSTTSDDLASGGMFDISQQKFVFEQDAPMVEMYRMAIANKWAYPGASSLGNDPMRSAFAQGKIAMYYGASYDLPEMENTYKTTINWAAAPNPLPEGTSLAHQVMNEAGGYTVYAKTKYPKAAVALLAYMSGKDAVSKTLDPGQFPLRNDVTLADTAPQVAEFAPTAGAVVNFTSPGKVVDITGQDYKDAIEALVLGTGDITSTLKNLDSKYDTAYQAGLQQGTISKSDYSE
jgi:multiple sugar transport system substrate-binding protein